MDFDSDRRRALADSLEGLVYPAQVNPNEIDWSLEPYSALEPDGTELPTYLTPFTDAETGATITRIGDQTAFGETNNYIRHNYSSVTAWNIDETLIRFSVGSQGYILDASDYTPTEYENMPADAQWSNSDPDLMYGVEASSDTFVSYRVSTDTRTILHTFDESRTYTSLSIGNGEGRLSNDDKYVTLTGISGGNTWLITYDIELDSIVAELQLPSGDLDFATISGTGDYVIVSWRDDGSLTNEGFKVYDRDLTNLRHVWDYTGHGDCGVDVNGNEVFVQFRSSEISLGDTERYLEMIQLDDGTVTGLYYDTDTPTPRGVWGGHVSCRNTNRPGWAYISEGRASDDVMANEIFAIKLSGTENIVERYGRHHSNPVNYLHEAQAVVNHNGTKVIFASNWYNTTVEGWTAAPSYILEWPQS